MADIVRFAIVTPTLDAGALLRQTVESVLACLGPEDRYTIVDGGSVDGSVDEILPLLPPNASVIRDRNGGMYDAIALGFERTPGDLMGWINASDLLLAGSLDTVRRAFRETGADLVHFDDLFIDERGQVLQRTVGTVDRPQEAMRLVGWTPLQDGCFWTRELYERCGGIDPRWRLAGDFDFFLRAFHRGRTAYVPGVVSAFRRHPNQLSRRHRLDYERENRQVRERFASENPQARSSLLALWRRRLELSLRARTGRNRRRTPLIGSHWQSVAASIE
ncbi:MAG: glycosyltransferase [Phycisphaerae bacterium]|nr:glycosyltransferase [Phycisphaerae bacterium]